MGVGIDSMRVTMKHLETNIGGSRVVLAIIGKYTATVDAHSGCDGGGGEGGQRQRCRPPLAPATAIEHIYRERVLPS